MKTLLKNLTLLPLVLLLLISIEPGVLPQEEEEEGSSVIKFVGADKCKICHNKAESGAQYTVWTKATHSQAFALLGSEEAKKVAKGLGIVDPQKSGKCLKCHSTAYFFTEEKVSNIAVKKDGSPRLTVEQGVSCESCHWAGSAYQKKKTMEIFDEAVKAGLNPHPEQNCLKCHNKDNPTWNPSRYTLKDGTKSGFDYDQAFEKIKHPNPLKAAERAKRKAESKKL